jgi:hypothetical protein
MEVTAAATVRWPRTMTINQIVPSGTSTMRRARDDERSEREGEQRIYEKAVSDTSTRFAPTIPLDLEGEQLGGTPTRLHAQPPQSICSVAPKRQCRPAAGS